MKQLKLLPTILVKYLLKMFYAGFCLCFKVDPNKITFASYRSDQLKGNLGFIYDHINKYYPTYEQKFIFKRLDSSLTGKINYLFHMIHACYQLATSRYFIIDDYYFPIYVIKPREGIEIIQLWHSAGALKKFGLSTVDKSFGPSREYLKHVHIHGNYSKVYVSSSEVIPFYAEAFQMSSAQIFPLGIPRTDFFYEKSRTEQLRTALFAAYPELIGKKLILYAPTFRGKSHYQAAFSLPFDVTYMKQQLADDYALLIHLHPYMRGIMESNDFLFHIETGFTIEELLVLTDILITDYSTVFFDFSILERPMIFFPYDLAAYKQERDFYYDYENIVPGPIVKNTEELVQTITARNYNMELVRDFKNRFFDYQDGKATERIVKHILKE